MFGHVIISKKKGMRLHFHVPIGALVVKSGDPCSLPDMLIQLKAADLARTLGHPLPGWGREWPRGRVKRKDEAPTEETRCTLSKYYLKGGVHHIFFSSRVRKIRLEEKNSNTGCSLNIVFFLKILEYSGLWSFSVFPRCQCVYTSQADRTLALQQNWQRSEKSQNFKEKTQYLMNTLYLGLGTVGATWLRQMTIKDKSGWPLIVDENWRAPPLRDSATKIWDLRIIHDPIYRFV